MKILPHHLRSKKRYVGFEVYGERPLTRDEVTRAIWHEVLAFLGENATSELNLWVLGFDEKSQRGFLTCSHVRVGEIKALLSLIGAVNGKRAMFHVLGVSGTIKALKRKFLT